MQSYEYRVVPAPRRAGRVKGARKPQDRFARTVEGEMNRLARDGWEFVRSDTLPCEQKGGWFSRPVTVFETVLVFRRPLAPDHIEANDLRHASAAMPPPVGLTPPAFVAAPNVAEDAPPVPAPSRAAPSASRFTPVPAAARPANLGEGAPAPTLVLVETAPGDQAPNPRHAAE